MFMQKRIAFFVLAAYFLVIPVAAFLTYKFLNNTKFEFKPPSGSIVAHTMDVANKYLSTQIAVNPFFIFAEEQRENESILTPSFENFSLELASMCNSDWRVFIKSVEGYYIVPPFAQLRMRYMGPHNATSVLLVDMVSQTDYSSMPTGFKTHWDNFHQHWFSNHRDATFTVHTTSIQQIRDDITSGIFADLVRIDSIVMPFAFLTLAYCLGSCRMLILPGIATPVAVLLSFSVMYPISLYFPIFSMAPEIIAAVILSMSIDYCLFIVSRFRDQVAAREAEFGVSNEVQWMVVKSATVLSANNIAVSGLTMAVALGSLMAVPISIMKSIGITFLVGCAMTVAVSLTLMPSLLLVFYNFFKQPAECAGIRQKLCPKNDSNIEQEASIDGIVGSEPDNSESRPLIVEMPLSSQTNGNKEEDDEEKKEHRSKPAALLKHEAQQRHLQYKSLWFKVGRFAFRHPVWCAIAVCIVGVPFFILATNLKVDFDLFHQVPRGSPHVETLRSIVSTIGQTTPFYVTFLTNRSGGIMDDRVFAAVNALTKRIAAAADQPLEMGSLISFAYVAGIELTAGEAETFYETNFLGYQYLFNRSVDVSRRAGMIAMIPTFDPFTAKAYGYLNTVYDEIHNFDTESLFTVGLTGASAMSWAVVREVMTLFPWLVGITFFFMFALTGLTFRSLVIPLRMLFTVAYTVGVTYGFGVLVFQYDWLHGIWTAMAGVTSYTWHVPIFSFFLLCALALDYDVFLLTRILEFKRIGYDDEAAISKAVWKTGRIISFAGVIMAISFCSLMFSNTTALNQFGLVSCFAVLLDTFVIRPLFVPALMSIYPALSWWPKKYQNKLHMDDMRESVAK